MNSSSDAERYPYAVVIPTRNRPARLDWCLDALAREQRNARFPVYVLDSSTSPHARREVALACARRPFVRLHFHNGINLSMARNACVRAAREPLLINVDDDIQVQPAAIPRLVKAYLDADGYRVVAGSVAWNDAWSRPVKLGPLGWGRPVRHGERPDFLIGAFLIFPRDLAVAFPWHERILLGPRRGVADDRYIGAIWRRKGVALLHAADAKAVHHTKHTSYGLPDEAARVYTNLVQACVGARSIRRALSFEVLGFLRGACSHMRHSATAREFLRLWVHAHAAFIRDRRYLRTIVSRDLPPLYPDPKAAGGESSRCGFSN